MSVQGISGGISPANLPPSQSGGNDTGTQVKALEQKLRQLGKEKQKAIQSKDEEAKKRIEKQMEEIRRQIEQLKSQGSKKREEEPAVSDVQDNKPKDPSLGNYVDEII